MGRFCDGGVDTGRDFPKIPGYPHLFVLDKTGTLLHSQNTSMLEDGKRSYDLERFTAFLKKWALSE